MERKGLGTIPIIIITAIVTLLMTFIGYKVWLYSRVLEYGVEYASVASVPQGATSNVSTEKTLPTTMQNKISALKKIIDTTFLYEYDEKEMADYMAMGMLASLNDPYAQYYNEDAFKTMMTTTEGEYYGIGIYVSYDEDKGMPIILLPIEESPAMEAGLKPGDYIEYVEDLKASEHSYTEIVDSIKGIPGSKVKIGIIRMSEDNKTSEKFEVEVERKKIELNPVKTKIYEDSIGYIRLSSFDEITYENFKNEYDTFMLNPKIKSLIIDLRDNPGGVFSTCVRITDLIVPEGKIVSTKDKQGNEEAVYSNSVRIMVPLVVLVNENSASASEVFTAAVKDYKAGVVIGKKTFGKGIVQTLLPLKDGSYVKLTTSEYFSPNGNKIHGIGVEPDIEVDLPEDVETTYNLEYEKDTQLQKAIEMLKSR